MKVNRKSWHYRLNSHFGLSEFENYSLCHYFWRTVTFTTLTLVLGTLAINAIATPLNEILNLFGLGIVDNEYLLRAMRIAGGIVWALAGIIGIVALCAYIDTNHGHKFKRVKRRVSERTSKSLVVSYAKAVKNRFCPMIEFHGAKS